MGKAIKKLKLVHEEFSLGVLIHQHVRAAVEQAVHEELATVLGVELYERSEARRGERNGVKIRTLTGPTGPMELTLPRARLFTPSGEQEWASKLVPRYQRRVREVNESVLAAYLSGTNTRRIAGALRPLLKATRGLYEMIERTELGEELPHVGLGARAPPRRAALHK